MENFKHIKEKIQVVNKCAYNHRTAQQLSTYDQFSFISPSTHFPLHTHIIWSKSKTYSTHKYFGMYETYFNMKHFFSSLDLKNNL